MEAEATLAAEEDETVRWVVSSSAASPHSSRPQSTSRIPAASAAAVPTETTRLFGDDGITTPLLGENSNPDDQNGTQHEPWMDNDGKPWWKRPSIYWVLPPLFPFTIAFGGVVVPQINLALTLICREYLVDQALKDPTFSFLPVVFGDKNPQCRLPEIQARASRFQLQLNLIAGTLAAIASPRLGVLTDGYGRTRIIALSAFGTFLGQLVMLMVASQDGGMSVNFLLLAAFLDGMFGSVTTAVALTQSYAADCVPPHSRNVAFGYFHGILFSGIALGPLIAGYLIKWTGNILIVFYSVLGCLVFFMLFMVFAVPESVSKSRQLLNRKNQGIGLFKFHRFSSWSLADFNPMNLLKPLSILFPSPTTALHGPPLRNVRINLIILASIDAVIFGVGMGTMSIIVIYSEYMFGWGNFEASIFVSIASSVRVVVLLVVLPTLTRLVRGPRSQRSHVNTGSDMLDIILIRISTILDLVGYLGYCFVRSGELLLASGAIAAMGAMASPTLTSSLTKHIPANRTGQLLGAIGLLHALARVVAPTIFNLIYSLTVGTLPQAVFMCLSATIALAMVASFFIKPHVYMENKLEPGQDSLGTSEQD
ncbi:tetracycline-efflux transporter [Blastomyces gilchristii SLH14081]|uniref:Tetracycline-efflux transporter n=1 Tax=Blastomyces gilchristii (strain SLH14081) TaxID=559298 RepID=A0A179V3L1_BLAGS|nr:tetracycline-efflux transporter [Blastomyces gilchristii SLH14081]OAT13192.1 tetracycline-efflux transporter [Blastomyces gilchristii SLH14081]